MHKSLFFITFIFSLAIVTSCNLISENEVSNNFFSDSGDNNTPQNPGGSGVFGTPSIYSTGSLPRSVYATDLDGDGDADLLSADFGS
ncbi:MAG: hypothetical protein HN576_10070, partial [Bacteriovoracaceae bacterium]|nr:hypothetical protein [Bacteriovoracaceae bacterium]